MLDTSGKQRLISYFIENIERGVFPPGSKVKATQDLADEFRIALTTAHSALKYLESQGYILRQRGKGTFIDSAHSGVASDHGSLKTRVCIVRNSGEAFKDHYGRLMLELNTRGADVDVVEYLYDNDEFLRKYDFHKCRIAVLVDPFSSELLQLHFPKVHQIYLGDIDPYGFRGDIVTYNYYEVAYRAVTHLADSGYKKIACYNITISGRGRFKRLESEHIASGYENAVRDCGLGYSCYRKYIPNKRGNDIVRGMLRSVQSPDAIICTFDHRAMDIIDVAEEMGLEIPKDLGLITLGSSSSSSEMKLTSVDFRPSALVPVCVNIIENIVSGKRNPHSSQHHLIHTEMMIRESCGYRLKFGEQERENRQKWRQKIEFVE